MTREREEHEVHVAIADNGGRDEHYDEHYDDDDDDDARRAFVGRIPRKFDTDSVRRILEQRLLASAGRKANVDKGKGSVVVDVSLAYPRDDGTERGRGGGGGGGGSDGNVNGIGDGNGNESGKGYGDGGENGESGRKHTRFDFDSDDGDDDQNRDRDRDDAAGAVGRGRGQGRGDRGGDKDKTDENEHLGYGFVTFASAADRDRAVALVTIRGGAKDSSRRKHTLYIRPVLRRKGGGGGGGVVVDEDVTGEPMADDGAVENKYACHLWPLKRCPYGDSCRFAHVGEGGCVAANNLGDGDDAATTKTKNGRRRQKCFSFKKRGKCRLGDACRFSHDVAVVAAKGGDNDGNDAGANDMSEANADDDDDGDAVDHPQEKDVGKGNAHDNTVDSEVVSEMNTKGTNIYNQEKMIEKDCLDWKIKGKCRRRGRGCPYRHDESVQKNSNKNGKGKNDTKSSGYKNKRRNKREKQPLRVRVFGLNYETSESDVRSHFEHCGPIVECAYPTFHDSGRSKGYCGLLFQSPKAVQKALELDGSILHDRWLRVQPGEMFERLWEKRERERRWDKSADDYNHNDDGGDAAAADAAKRYRKKEDGEAGAGSGASDKGDGNKYEKVQSVRDTENDERDGTTEAPMVGEFGQKVKKRKRHGYALDKA